MAKTKGELISMIENELVDPTSNKITGERVKNAMKDIVDAMGEGGGMEYWSLEGVSGEDLGVMGEFLYLAPVVKAVSSTAGITMIAAPYFAFSDNSYSPTAFAWNGNLKTNLSGSLISLSEMLTMSSIAFADFGAVKITEEEFYTI